MTDDRAVDTVLFDLGQVLVGWDPYLAYAGIDPAEVTAFFDEIDFPAFNHLQDAGRTWGDARIALARSHPHRVGMLDRYVERFADSVTGEVPGAAATVRALRGAGVRVVGLSNWSAETFHVAGDKAPVVRLLEDVVVSGEVGLAKPDAAIFRLATQRLGLDPARTLFVDDLARNVEAARALGYQVHHFTDHDRLRAALTDLGVRLGP